ncbi:S-layer homology domain-containing protein [Saccharibacillus sp. JS10]|uniref:S-layer homology domain-containing protein n=1 Tax=Saccharibacillus sp. JS10 TaxID=2950552 RepID=UPI002108FC9E|nr:S-layer homology domain-containing protein [Saccharibacillus sp. JS10]MCQ4086726.1 S-layer homology domain-containing protein [Saccharibacillus sp. JS10]
MNIPNKIVASLLVATSIMSSLSSQISAATDSENSFKDLNTASTWSRDSIVQAKLLGLLEGDQQGNFRPNDRITRQEMAKILVQLLNLPLETTASSFKDVPTDSWSTAYIEAARKAGMMQGYGNGKFDPQAEMTREQLAIVFVKALGLPINNDVTALNRFSDASSIHSWSSQYVAAALRAGLMTGTGSTFGATSKANRQETAIIAVRVHTQKQQMTSQPNPTDVPANNPAPAVTPVPTPTPAPSIPSSGSGNSAPPISVPNPIEQSLPAVAISRPISDLNFENTETSSAVLISKPIRNLDFSINQLPASATSKPITDFDFSVVGTPATLEVETLTTLESDLKQFTIENHKENEVRFNIGHINFMNTDALFSYITVYLKAINFDVTVNLDPSKKKLSITENEPAQGSYLKVSGPDSSRFKSTFSISQIDIDHSKTFTINDGEKTATILLNKNYSNLSDIVNVINQQLTLANVDASATKVGDTFTITRTSMANDGQLTFGGTQPNDFFDNNVYKRNVIWDRSAELEIQLGAEKANVLLNRKYDSLDDLALYLSGALYSSHMDVSISNEEDILKVSTVEKGSSQKFIVTENSDDRIFVPGTYSGKDFQKHNRSIVINDGIFTTTVVLHHNYSNAEELASDVYYQLSTGKARVGLDLTRTDLLKVVSKVVGKNVKLTIKGEDSAMFFDKEIFVGSGPEVDHAPILGGIRIVPLPEQVLSDRPLTPVSGDTDIVNVELMRSTTTGLDYAKTDYIYPVKNYTLGTEINTEGSYRLTVTDAKGQQTITYFSIETTYPAIVSITQEQSKDPSTSPYKYDKGDKLIFKTNNFVWKQDSKDELVRPPSSWGSFSRTGLEKALKSVPGQEGYTFGEGTILTTDELFAMDESYGRTFTLTLGEGANIPSTGIEIPRLFYDLISPAGLLGFNSFNLVIPALQPPA